MEGQARPGTGVGGPPHSGGARKIPRVREPLQRKTGSTDRGRSVLHRRYDRRFFGRPWKGGYRVRSCKMLGTGGNSAQVSPHKEFVIPAGGYFFSPSITAMQEVPATEKAAERWFTHRRKEPDHAVD